jgi:glycosyltransferase involved in cell wall biosynthesis
MWRCLERANADVYYQQTAGMLTGVVVAYCRRRGKKSVFAAASDPDLVPNTPRIKYRRDKWIYEYGLRNADKIFVQNAEQTRLCRENFGRDSTLVRNCYSLPPCKHLAATKKYVLWVSTIRRLKQPHLFLDLAEAFPAYQFLMIGGPGDKEDANLFRDVARRAEAIGNVQFLGFVPFSRVEGYFDDAALLVNTSDSEGFPNAFLQAWGRGVPSIAFVDPGAALDGRPVGVRARSFREMTSQVGELMADQELRLALGERSARYVKEFHSPEKVIPIYEQEFEELARSVVGSNDRASAVRPIPQDGE